MYERCTSEMGTVTEVELSTYQYDNPKVHQALVYRLRGRRPFRLNVYIDKEMLKGSTPKMQKTRLAELRHLKAKIYECKGIRGKGSWHCKGIVLDKRVLYTGSANATGQSVDNNEIPLRITGPVVQKVLENFASARAKFPLWKA